MSREQKCYIMINNSFINFTSVHTFSTKFSQDCKIVKLMQYFMISLAKLF